jgi:hypothetical protein
MKMPYQLKIWSIACIDEQEAGGDEPYLNFNGISNVWESDGDMTQGEIQAPPAVFEFNGASADLSLWEDDGDHWYDRNDHFGTETIYASQAGQPAFSLDYTTDNAHYTVLAQVAFDPFG